MSSATTTTATATSTPPSTRVAMPTPESWDHTATSMDSEHPSVSTMLPTTWDSAQPEQTPQPPLPPSVSTGEDALWLLLPMPLLPLSLPPSRHLQPTRLSSPESSWTPATPSPTGCSKKLKTWIRKYFFSLFYIDNKIDWTKNQKMMEKIIVDFLFKFIREKYFFVTHVVLFFACKNPIFFLCVLCRT